MSNYKQHNLKLSQDSVVQWRLWNSAISSGVVPPSFRASFRVLTLTSLLASSRTILMPPAGHDVDRLEVIDVTKVLEFGTKLQ